MRELQIGDVVVLKSGGPEMTVADRTECELYVVCEWFGPKGVESYDFTPAMLVLVPTGN